MRVTPISLQVENLFYFHKPSSLCTRAGGLHTTGRTDILSAMEKKNKSTKHF